ncbi:MAG: MFS transporter [Chloroflexi bacterium]|nr:MFS transporter [Chloroflexota bacterium]
MSIKPLARIRKTYNEYPQQFWILILGIFIDRLGGALMFPFFTLYVTKKFDVGMTEVGILFAVFSISSIVGSMLGGALTDRLGRKGMLIFGLVASALTSLLMGMVGTIELFFGTAMIVGLLANMGGPAGQAMVADLLPEKKRAQGFGILRVVANLAVTIGPAIGGLLATQSYMLLFICDAITSTITAIIVALAIRETKPEAAEDEPEQTMAQTFGGYGDVLRDTVYVLFMGACILMTLVYMQMNTTLAVYLRDVHSIPEQGFGYILSLNAGIVVLFQFSITRWIAKYRPLLVMTVGMLLYAIGFGMYGFVSTYILFMVAMVIITIGEMMTAPTSQALVAQLAPEDMRGRYMAVYGFTWVIPSAIGPLLAGLVMDNADPRWVWYIAGLLGIVATGAFILLERRAGISAWAAVDERLKILQMLEEKKISAEKASTLLQGLKERQWAAAGTTGPSWERRHLRIQVSDVASGTLTTNMVLPMGLVNTVLYTGGRLTDDLDSLDLQELERLVDSSAAGQGIETMRTDADQQVEILVENGHTDG